MAKIAILVEKMYEDAELQYPRLRLKEAGHDVHIVGPKANETYVGKYGYPQRSERAASAVRAEDYQLSYAMDILRGMSYLSAENQQQ